MARNFNGTSDVATTATFATSATSNITVSAWVKPTTTPSGDRYFFANGGGNNNDGFSVGTSTQSFGGVSGQIGVACPGVGVAAFGASAIAPASVWSNIIITLTGTNTWAVFLNGTSAGSAINPAMGGSAVSTSLIGVGNISGGAFGFSNDSIADVAVWTAVLTQGEIGALSLGARPYTIRRPSLVAWWPLDGLQSPEPDLSGAKNNGTLTGTSAASGPALAMLTPRWLTNWPPVMLYLRPDADDADGGWTTETGGTTLFASIDEPTVDDADYIKSATAPQNDIARVRISDPGGNIIEPFNVRYRYKKAGDGTVDLIVRLKQGTTLIKAWTHSNIGTTFTTVTQTLSSGEFASITDFTDLFVEFEADTP